MDDCAGKDKVGLRTTILRVARRKARSHPLVVRLKESMALHGQLIDVNLDHKEIAGLVCYVHPCFQIVY